MRIFQLSAVFSFAVIFSIWLGKADTHTDDTGVLVGLIGIGGFLLAMVEPRRPWIWGLMVPAGVILVEVWGYFHKLRDAGTGGPGGLLGIAALTIAIACAGAYLGAFVRRQVSRVV